MSFPVQKAVNSSTRQGQLFEVSCDSNGVPVLTKEQISFFWESGYIALDRIAPEEDVKEIRATLEALFQRKAGFEEGRQFNILGADSKTDGPVLPQILSPHWDAKNLRNTVYFRNASAVATQLLGPQAFFDMDHVLMKPPINGPATPRHQDESYRLPQYEYNEVSFWMPLQPVDSVNGCMEFFPRTHRSGILPHRSLNNDPTVHALECYEGYDLADLVSCPLPAGGCTIHTGLTLHSAGPNRSPEPRYAYVLIFQVPPTRRKRPRVFPWEEGRETERMQRERAWLMRDGLLVAAWRKFRKTPLRDYGRFFSRVIRRLRK